MVKRFVLILDQPVINYVIYIFIAIYYTIYQTDKL